MSKTPVVDFQGVSKSYPAGWLGHRLLPAVTEVSFSLSPGEVFGLVGPNRAGKTTLVKILLSLCRPTRGNVFRLGQPLSERSTLARVGYMHENQAFPRYWNAAGLLQFYGALALLPESHIPQRVAQLLDLVGLSDRCHEPIARFSKGMIQRLALAQALLNDPELLVLDEPTEGLDLAGRHLLFQVVEQQRRRGGTALLVSHALTEVQQYCDRIAVLVNGRLIKVGPLTALTRDTQTGAVCPLECALKDLYERCAA
jgi:ABC-2 type transport system ATP-binding protein